MENLWEYRHQNPKVLSDGAGNSTAAKGHQ